MLPAGLNYMDISRVEIFSNNNKAFALYRGKVISFFDLPQNIINVFRREMNGRPNYCKSMGIDHIKDENERLEKYIMADYGEFNNIPDFDNGKTTPEVFGNDAITFFGLTKREVEVLKLTAIGNHIPEISRQLCIDPKTAEKHSHNIKEKIKAKTGYDMIRFAIRHKLVEVA